METKAFDNGSDAIEAVIELDAHDRERAMDYNFFVKKKWILADIIFFVLLSLTLLILNFTGIVDISNVLVYCAFGLLVLIALFFIMVKMMSQVSAGNQKRYITITKQGLKTHVGGEKKEFTLSWGDFAHIGKTKNYYFLYPDNSQFLIIPKRCFSKEENQKILSYIK